MSNLRDFAYGFERGYSHVMTLGKYLNKGAGAWNGIRTLSGIGPRMLPTQGIQRNRTIYNKGNPLKARVVTGSNPKPIYGSNPGKRLGVPARRAPIKRYRSSYLKKRRMKRRNKF